MWLRHEHEERRAAFLPTFVRLLFHLLPFSLLALVVTTERRRRTEVPSTTLLDDTCSCLSVSAAAGVVRTPQLQRLITCAPRALSAHSPRACRCRPRRRHRQTRPPANSNTGRTRIQSRNNMLWACRCRSSATSTGKRRPGRNERAAPMGEASEENWRNCAPGGTCTRSWCTWRAGGE